MLRVDKIEKLPRPAKRKIAFLVNMLLIAFCLCFALALRFGMIALIHQIHTNWILFPTMLLFGAIAIKAMRLDYIKIHAVEYNIVLNLAVFSLLLAACAIIVILLFDLAAPHSVPLIFGATFFMLSVIVHFLGRLSFEFAGKCRNRHVPVAIYGAGNTGEQLAAALRQNDENMPVCFLDDNCQLHGLMIGRLKVYPTSSLPRLIKKYKLKRILIAMPSVAAFRRKEIAQALSTQPVEIIELPNASDELGNQSIKRVVKSEYSQDDANAPNPKLPNPEVLSSCYGKTVFIAGAGGAVGTEISQQIIQFEPAKIILFELNETALIQVMNQVQNVVARTGSKTVVLARTGSIGVIDRVRQLIKSEGVDIIINCAHFSNQRLYEGNFIDRVTTNVLGPVNLAEVAIEQKIEQLVLLFTELIEDSTHAMGKPQTLAECLVMGLASKATKTKISFLRFGRTLGAAGSIVPLLEQQIRDHGTVMLPDSEMTRFFTTTARVANIILCALPHADSLHAKPVHLSKGKPQKLMDFVNQALDITGKGIRSEINPSGVEVKFTGLRPGEVLHETCLYQKRCKPLQENSDLLLSQNIISPSMRDHEVLMKSFITALELYDENALSDLLDTSSPRKVLQVI